MVEAIKHVFGCCGESHTNVFYLLVSLPLLVVIKYQIIMVMMNVKLKFKNIWAFLKTGKK